MMILTPPPPMRISEWAKKYAYLSLETSAELGRFDAYPYQVGIMDVLNDPTVRHVTVMKSARVGYTKCLDNIIGYFVEHEPSPILVVQPRITDADDYSRSEIGPMLRDTPVLARLLTENPGESNQRISKRLFANGASVAFVGANAPGGFRRITVRIVLFDEVDGFPVGGAGREGDQISLGTHRADSFFNGKIVIGSTPSVKGMSRVEKSFLESDQRYYFVPCPSCGHKQVLKWHNLRWDKTEDANGTKVHLPETAHFVCSENGCIIEERHKRDMLSKGEWIATAPFRDRHAGFHIWTAYSPLSEARWSNLVAQHLRIGSDVLERKTFVNAVLGETWEESAETVDPGRLISRAEQYSEMSIPDKVEFLTAGVDVQGDRLELQVLGWGHREECWAVYYKVMYGDPSQMTVWAELDMELRRKFSTENNRELMIRTACIDSQGHQTNQVLQFCRDRWARRIFPINGTAGSRPIWPSRASKNKQHMTFFSIGVDTAKDTIYGRLRIDQPGPGYIHFPLGAPFDQTYFDQLTVERVMTRFRLGRPYRVWDAGGKANEALDTFVYALAARMSLPRSRAVVVGRPAPTGIGGVVPTQNEAMGMVGDERPRVSLAKRLPH